MTSKAENTTAWSDPTALNDPAHMAFLMGSIGKIHIARTSSPYKPAPRKPHDLNQSQKESLDQLKVWCPELLEGFTARELKKAFHRAALILHPDQGGTVADFLSLKGHYLNLQLVFLSKQNINIEQF